VNKDSHKFAFTLHYINTLSKGVNYVYHMWFLFSPYAERRFYSKVPFIPSWIYTTLFITRQW